MNLYCIIFGTLFITAGIVFFTGFGNRWLKGLNELTDGEKKELNIKKLDRLLGRIFLSVGLIFEAGGFNEAFLRSAFIWLMLAWFIMTGIAVYLISKLFLIAKYRRIIKNERKWR